MSFNNSNNNNNNQADTANNNANILGVVDADNLTDSSICDYTELRSNLQDINTCANNALMMVNNVIDHVTTSSSNKCTYVHRVC